jgi:preprotein translocase subunit SecE
MGPNKYVHIMFAVGCLLLAYLLAMTGEWVWSYFGKPRDLIVSGAALVVAVLVALSLYRNERVFTAALEVTRELEKVTWPTRKETSSATVVVVATVAIAAVILASFDFVWGRLANLVLR